MSDDAAGGDAGTGPGGLLNAAGDVRNTDPRIAALAYNGGPTQTHALLPDSPAINAGNDSFAPLLDQRGFGRSGVSDIGAFEFSGVPPAVPVVGAASRKTHGSAGAHDIGLPLSGAIAVECRSGGPNGDYTVLFSFANPVNSVGNAAVTSGTGLLSSSQVGSDPRTYVVNLSGVTNAQRVTVTLFDVTDSLGSHSSAVPVTFGILIGDTNGSGGVTASDIGQMKAASGQPVSAMSFYTDANANGVINATDIGMVKSLSGTHLP